MSHEPSANDWSEPLVGDDAGTNRDLEAQRLDQISVLQDHAADTRDRTADQRDLRGQDRDTAGRDRDQAAQQRDWLAERRDDTATHRDRQASIRDSSAESPQTPPGMGQAEVGPGTPGTAWPVWAALVDELAKSRISAALDRANSARDRVAANTERIAAEVDRDAARSDRNAGLTERTSAARDRRSSVADRKSGADRRDHADDDRAGALSDRQAADQARHASSRDELTGAFSRGAGFLELSATMMSARRLDHELFLAFIDVDHLKQINDTHGHAAGDIVLVRVASELRSVLEADDLLTRYGGDEFFVAFSGTDLASASLRLRRVAVELSLSLPAVSVSVGLAQMRTFDTATQLVARADTAMYQVRHQRPD